MRIWYRINLVLVVLLGIAAGIPKILRVPDEVLFFQNRGFGTTVLVAFGVLQSGAGLLMISPKTRIAGATITAVMFLASAIMLVMSGQVAFAAVSLVPVLMAVMLVVYTATTK